MPGKKNRLLSSTLSFQSASREQSSFLEEDDKKWSWKQVAVFVLLVYVSMSFMNGCFSIIDLKSQENAVLAQTFDAQAEKKRLENEVSYLQTQEAVEKTAREDLKMVKPGEILLTQRDNSNKSNASDKADDKAKESKDSKD